jgi:hypothetical protein
VSPTYLLLEFNGKCGAVHIFYLTAAAVVPEKKSGQKMGQPRPKYFINHLVLPSFIVHVIGLAALWTLWYYLR